MDLSQIDVLWREKELLLGDLPLHIIIVTSVMSLELLFHVEQHDHRRDEVHGLARRQQVQIAAAVPTPVAIARVLVKLQ